LGVMSPGYLGEMPLHHREEKSKRSHGNRSFDPQQRGMT
jgi:hypothetical protein